MAIYHLNIKPLSRSRGHTVGEALAYETGQVLSTVDGRTADFSRKSGVEQFRIIGTRHNLQNLADKVELSEKRRNSTLGRRMTIALPAELDKRQRWQAASEFGEWLHKEYGVAVVLSIHAPDRAGDRRNHHAHITISDRRVTPGGEFGEKARELTAARQSKVELGKIRQKWENVANIHLELSGHWGVEISHRSNKARGVSTSPTCHLGRVRTHQARKGYGVHKHIHNQTIAEHDRGNSKSRPREIPAQEGGGDSPVPGPGNPGDAERTAASNTATGAEEPIRGSKKWFARERAKKHKEREKRLGGPLEEVKAILGSIRERIREIGGKLPNAPERGAKLRRKDNYKGFER